MPPFLPPELVTITFEHLYDSLCYSRTQGTYDAPIGAGFVFSNLSLVSKNWHSLALPFLVRNFQYWSNDSEGIEVYLKFVRDHHLARCVETIGLDVQNEGQGSHDTLWLDLFRELHFEWNLRALRVSGHIINDSCPVTESFAASLPFLGDLKGLVLEGLILDIHRVWTPQLPSHLATLNLRIPWNRADGENLEDSIQLEIARRCSSTLRTLTISSMMPRWIMTIEELFGDRPFPLLTDLHLSAVSCVDFDLSMQFPQLLSVSLALPADLDASELPKLSSSLSRVALSHVMKPTLHCIADNLEEFLRPVEALEIFEISVMIMDDENWIDMGCFKLEDVVEDHPKFGQIEQFCRDRSILFNCYEWDPLLRSLHEERFKIREGEFEDGANSSEGDETEDEEDLDFDAEDGEEFRHLWSEGKLASLTKDGGSSSLAKDAKEMFDSSRVSI